MIPNVGNGNRASQLASGPNLNVRTFGGRSRSKPAQLADYLKGALRSLLHPAAALAQKILASAVSSGVLSIACVNCSHAVFLPDCLMCEHVTSSAACTGAAHWPPPRRTEGCAAEVVDVYSEK